MVSRPPDRVHSDTRPRACAICDRQCLGFAPGPQTQAAMRGAGMVSRSWPLRQIS